MVSFPNCKINLGLNIIQKRQDGYHDIETVFYPIKINDAVEIIKQPATGHQPSGLLFTGSGLPVVSDEENNLCIKAYHLLKKDFPQLPAIAMHLHKAIPIGAGLGGGSADGAFVLQLLNKKFQLGLSSTQLINYALQLGSDCPFFIINQPCFAQSRGEVLEKINLDLSAYKFLIINPNIHINTSEAFAQIKPRTPIKSIKTIIHQPIETWKAELINDFEEIVFDSHPLIKNIKQQLYQHGALYASMSGSGSTCFGIFPRSQTLGPTIFPNDYFVREIETK